MPQRKGVSDDDNTDQGRSTTAEMEARRPAPPDFAEVDEDTAGHALVLANVNETVVEDAPADEQGDTEGHLAGTNVNETVVEDAAEDDTTGHGLYVNVNETVVEDALGTLKEKWQRTQPRVRMMPTRQGPPGRRKHRPLARPRITENARFGLADGWKPLSSRGFSSMPTAPASVGAVLRPLVRSASSCLGGWVPFSDVSCGAGPRMCSLDVISTALLSGEAPRCTPSEGGGR